MLERVEPITHLLQAGAHVGEGQRRPVGEVPFGGRAMPGEIPQGELCQGLGAPEPARCRHALAHERVGVLAVDDSSAADKPVQLGVGMPMRHVIRATCTLSNTDAPLRSATIHQIRMSQGDYVERAWLC